MSTARESISAAPSKRTKDKEFLSDLKEEEESNDVLTVGREETDGHGCCQTVSVLVFIYLSMRLSVSSEVLVERGRERERANRECVYSQCLMYAGHKAHTLTYNITPFS